VSDTDCFEVITKYDSHFDMLGIKKVNKYKYNKSVEMRDGVILDFDTDDKPAALQIIDASKLFDIPKSSFHNIPMVEMSIKINESCIRLDLTIGVYVHNKKMEQTFNSLIDNISGLPNFEADLATA
jgi:hypothetical protein